MLYINSSVTCLIFAPKWSFSYFQPILADHFCYHSNCTCRINTRLLHFGYCYNKLIIVGRICNNFEKNRAFYDKSMKLGTWLVDNKTKKIRVSATPKMPSNGRHLVFPKWPPFFNLFIIISLFICKHHVFFS